MFFSDKETKAESQDHSLAASEWSGTENYKAKSRALITNLLCLTKERKKKKKRTVKSYLEIITKGMSKSANQGMPWWSIG